MSTTRDKEVMDGFVGILKKCSLSGGEGDVGDLLAWLEAGIWTGLYIVQNRQGRRSEGDKYDGGGKIAISMRVTVGAGFSSLRTWNGPLTFTCEVSLCLFVLLGYLPGHCEKSGFIVLRLRTPVLLLIIVTNRLRLRRQPTVQRCHREFRWRTSEWETGSM